MALSSAQIQLIQKTFNRLRPRELNLLTALFYSRLFAINPTLRPFFQQDMRPQCRKFAQFLTLVVESLEEFDQSLPTIRLLGEEHLAFGVYSEDYESFEVALLWALKEVLSTEFTPEAYDAWSAVYRLLARTTNADLYQPAHQ